MSSSEQSASPSGIAEVVRSRLDRWGVPYRWITIDPDFADTAQFCEKYGYSLENSVNCILLVAKTEPRRFAACLVQAVRRVDVNRTARRLLGARRVSFASAEETVEVTGMLPGGVTPVALPDGMPVYVDAPVAELDEIILGGGDRSTKLFVATAPLLERLPGAVLVPGLSLGPGWNRDHPELPCD